MPHSRDELDRDQMTRLVEASFFRSARGYRTSVTETKRIATARMEPAEDGGEPVIEKIVASECRRQRHLAPNPKAALQWLKQFSPDWREPPAGGEENGLIKRLYMKREDVGQAPAD